MALKEPVSFYSALNSLTLERWGGVGGCFSCAFVAYHPTGLLSLGHLLGALQSGPRLEVKSPGRSRGSGRAPGLVQPLLPGTLTSLAAHDTLLSQHCCLSFLWLFLLPLLQCSHLCSDPLAPSRPSFGGRSVPSVAVMDHTSVSDGDTTCVVAKGQEAGRRLCGGQPWLRHFSSCVTSRRGLPSVPQGPHR